MNRRCTLSKTIAAITTALAVLLTPAPNAAMATVRETLSFAAVPSDGVLNNAANATRTGNVGGGYQLGRIMISGTMTSLISSTFLVDSRIQVTTPGGHSFTFSPFGSGGYFTTQAFSTQIYLPQVTDPAGPWSFRFFELLDNGGPGVPDASVTISFAFTDEPAQPPAATNLGTLTRGGIDLLSQPLSTGQVRWFRFNLPCAIGLNPPTHMDIYLHGSALASTPSNDTEMALYDVAGSLVAVNDDAGPGFTSQLSFGAGVREPVLDGSLFSGSDGSLAAGDYYLAIAEHDLVALPFWQVSTNGISNPGTIAVHVRTNVSPTCCPADLDNGSGLGTRDGAVTIDDLVFFLQAFEAGSIDADVDDGSAAAQLDQSVTIDDLLFFLARFEMGC